MYQLKDLETNRDGIIEIKMIKHLIKNHIVDVFKIMINKFLINPNSYGMIIKTLMKDNKHHLLLNNILNTILQMGYFDKYYLSNSYYKYDYVELILQHYDLWNMKNLNQPLYDFLVSLSDNDWKHFSDCYKQSLYSFKNKVLNKPIKEFKFKKSFKFAKDLFKITKTGGYFYISIFNNFNKNNFKHTSCVIFKE